jgi:hypothetical protein
MKKLTFVFLASILLLSGCSNMKLLRSWENKEQIPKQFNNLAIAALTPNNSNRYIVERAIVDYLKKDGYKVMPTYDAMPFAGRIGELGKDAGGSEGIKKIVRAKMEEHKIDGLMVLSVFNKEIEDRWVNNRSYAPYGAGYYGVPFGYAGRYYDYYSYSMGTTIYNDGHYVKDVTYYIECNLYAVASEEILWSGQISVKNIENMEAQADELAYIITQQLIRKKVLSK